MGINVAVVAAVCQAIDNTCKDILEVDSVATATLLKVPNCKHMNRKRAVIDPTKKLVLFIVHQDKSIGGLQQSISAPEHILS